MKYYRISNKEDIEKYSLDIKELLLRVYSVNFPNVEISDDFLINEIEKITSYILNGTASIYVCVLDDHIVGLIWAYMRHIVSGTEMHISILVVKQGYERRGIAQKLLESVKEEARNRGISKMTLMVSSDNDVALTFYQKNKFIEKRKLLECEVVSCDN